MKKDEIVALSNDIEIIDGIEIDWSKFKGSNSEKSKISYVNLIKTLNKFKVILISEYLGTAKEIVVKIDKTILKTTPQSFCRNTINSIEKFNKLTKLEGDKHLEFVRVVNKNTLVSSIRCFDGGIVEVDLNTYKSFIKGRKELYSEVENIGGKIISPYYSNKDFIKILLNEAEINARVGDFKNGTLGSIKKFFNTLKEENDEFVKFTKYKKGVGLYVKIKEKYLNKEIEIPITQYNNNTSKSWVENRRRFYEICKEKGYTALTHYTGAYDKVKIDFGCGHKINEVRPNCIINKDRGCPWCSNNSAQQAEEKLRQEIEKIGYKISGEYKNSTSKIEFECDKGHRYISTYSVFRQGCRCPKCKRSKGEEDIASVLEKFDIKFTEQYKFEDCRVINPLPFDFYIFEFNLCIEYDGLQHYEPVAYWKKEDSDYKRLLAQKIAEERLRETKRRDKIKTDYCKNNGINLIRIPYWEFDNIESIIKKELNKY